MATDRTRARRARPRPLLLPVTLLVAFVAMAMAAAAWDVWPGDLAVLRFAQGRLNGFTEPVLNAVDFLGETTVTVAVALSAGASLLVARRVRLAAVLLLSVAIGGGAVSGTKWLVDRPRPVLPDDLLVLADAGSPSFPSGHAALSLIVFGALAYLVYRHWWRSGVWARGLAAALCVPIVLMGPTRVAWGVHWPSDVAGSYVLGALSIALLAWLHGRFVVVWARSDTGGAVTLANKETLTPGD